MKRPSGSKPEVIDVSSDEEASSDQPAKKKVKKNPESAPSQELVELQKKVAKLEKDFQGACRYARQYELQLEESKKRSEFLENILDTKPLAAGDDAAKKLVDELQKKLAESSKQVVALTQQLETERDQAREHRKKDQERSQEAATHLSTVQLQLEVERWRANVAPTRDRESNIELMRQLAECQVVAFNIQQKANEDRMRDSARIDELSGELAQYEEWWHWHLLQPPPPPPPTDPQMIEQAEKEKKQRKAELKTKVEEVLKQIVVASMFADPSVYKNTLKNLVSACIEKEQKMNSGFDYTFSDVFKRRMVEYTKDYVQRHKLKPLSHSK